MEEALLDVVISHLQDPANMSVEELFQKASYCETKRQEVVAKLEGPKAPKSKRSERKLLKEHFTWMVAGHAYETELAKRNAGLHQT